MPVWFDARQVIHRTHTKHCLMPAPVYKRATCSDSKGPVRLFIQQFPQPLILYLLLLRRNKRITFSFINDGPLVQRCLQKFSTSVCCTHFSAGLQLFLMLNDAHPLCKFYGQMCLRSHSSYWMSACDEASAGLLCSFYYTLTNDTRFSFARCMCR